MRMPYIVGRWVKGANHYGRERLITYLLTVPDNAIWVVGTRRMGKTSLLRQLEQLTEDDQKSAFVPLFLDLQGCESAQDFSFELQYAIEEAEDRFAQFGVDPDVLIDADAIFIVRHLQRALHRHDHKLLLLIDEAEVLIRIGEEEPNWLARLRKVLHSDRQRTIITATKLLARLNDVSAEWTTSPFLFGFNLVNLWSLDPAAAEGLIRQTQGNEQVAVAQDLVDEIVDVTNRHPYLIQFLCQRLYNGDQGSLRPITDVDLQPDHLLAGFFKIDFQHLSYLERRLLLIISDLSLAAEKEILAAASDESPGRLRTFLYGLHKLNYIRQVDERWMVGNAFFEQWLRHHAVELRSQIDSDVSDRRMEELLQRSADQEQEFLQHEITRLQAMLAHLNEQRMDGAGDARAVQQNIEQVRRELARVQGELAMLKGALASPQL